MIHDVGTPSGRLSRNEVSLRELLGGGGATLINQAPASNKRRSI